MPTENTQDLTNLAEKLRDYLEANPSHAAFGFGRDRPGKAGNGNPHVQAFQQAVGIRQDGIMGPDTRREGKKVGVTFPRRPGASGSKTQGTD